MVAQVWPRDSPSRLTRPSARRPNGRCYCDPQSVLYFPLDVIIRTTCLNVRFPFFFYLPPHIYMSFLLPSSFFFPSHPSLVSLFRHGHHIRLYCYTFGLEGLRWLCWRAPRDTPLACQLLNRWSFIHVAHARSFIFFRTDISWSIILKQYKYFTFCKRTNAMLCFTKNS